MLVWVWCGCVGGWVGVYLCACVYECAGAGGGGGRLLSN